MPHLPSSILRASRSPRQKVSRWLGAFGDALRQGSRCHSHIVQPASCVFPVDIAKRSLDLRRDCAIARSASVYIAPDDAFPLAGVLRAKVPRLKNRSENI